MTDLSFRVVFLLFYFNPFLFSFSLVKIKIALLSLLGLWGPLEEHPLMVLDASWLLFYRISLYFLFSSLYMVMTSSNIGKYSIASIFFMV